MLNKLQRSVLNRNKSMIEEWKPRDEFLFHENEWQEKKGMKIRRAAQKHPLSRNGNLVVRYDNKNNNRRHGDNYTLETV